MLLNMLNFVITYLGVLLCIFSAANSLSFTIEELKAINYEVDISQMPVKKGEEQILPVVYMTSIFGQEYQCLLPQVEEDETSEKLVYSEKNTDIKELLRPLHIGNCLLKAKDWWTYELCFGQYIKQFHIEDGQIIGQVLTLGLYDSDYDWNNETEEEKFKHMKQRYHSQYYVNGTKCDLTGHPRVAEVRIFCEEDSGDYIHRVDEPGTCSYVITVHTSRVCSHPQLKPLPTKKAHTIPCQPLLSDEQYSSYLKILSEEKALADQERNQWLNTQQERLQEIKNEIVHPAESAEERDKATELNKILAEDKQNFIPDDLAVKNLEKKEIRKSTSNLKTEVEEMRVYSDEIIRSLFEEYDIGKVLKSANDLNSDKVEEKSDDLATSLFYDEFDKELEKLKSFLTPDKFASLKFSIQEFFDALLKEVENSKNTKSIEDDEKSAAFEKLASTLKTLLKKLDKAEKDVVEATKRLNEAKLAISGTASDHVESEAFNVEESLIENAMKHMPAMKPKIVIDKVMKDDSLLEEDDNKNNDDFQVRIRRLDRIHSDGKSFEIDRAQQKKLEQAIKEKLEKYGVNTEGRKIEVKIIKAGFFGSQLTDHEASQFENMITALLTGEQEAIQEMERNKKLEENYKFTWKNDIEEDEGE